MSKRFTSPAKLTSREVWRRWFTKVTGENKLPGDDWMITLGGNLTDLWGSLNPLSEVGWLIGTGFARPEQVTTVEQDPKIWRDNTAAAPGVYHVLAKLDDTLRDHVRELDPRDLGMLRLINADFCCGPQHTHVAKTIKQALSIPTCGVPRLVVANFCEATPRWPGVCNDVRENLQRAGIRAYNYSYIYPGKHGERMHQVGWRVR